MPTSKSRSKRAAKISFNKVQGGGMEERRGGVGTKSTMSFQCDLMNIKWQQRTTLFTLYLLYQRHITLNQGDMLLII